VNGFYTIFNGDINKHISDGKNIIATKVDNLDSKIIYYTQNNIGSTTMLTDNTGAPKQSYLYKPYGEEWVTEYNYDDSDIERKFTGQMYDSESKLYYYNARYYSAETGMFISPDPGMSGLNFYAYASANPIKYTDPTGLDDQDNWDGHEDAPGWGTTGNNDWSSLDFDYNDFTGHTMGNDDMTMGYSPGDESSLDTAYGGNGTDLTWGGRNGLDYANRDQFGLPGGFKDYLHSVVNALKNNPDFHPFDAKYGNQKDLSALVSSIIPGFGYYAGYSSLCLAYSYMLAHDYNVGIYQNIYNQAVFLIDAFINNMITPTGWVKAEALPFTTAYANFFGTSAPKTEGTPAQFGVGVYTWFDEDQNKHTHFSVIDFYSYSNTLTTNPYPGLYDNEYYAPSSRLSY
jgi:RHS repeat-associated protein